MCSDFRVLTEGRVKGMQTHRFAKANSRTNRKTPIKDEKAENKTKQKPNKRPTQIFDPPK